MSPYQNEGNFDYSTQENGGKYYKTNLFLKEAGTAMGLPPEPGARVARLLLQIIAKSVNQEKWRLLKETLPQGLGQECELYSAGIPREEISSSWVKNRIQETTEMDIVDPDFIAREFWSYFSRWIENDNKKNQALPSLLLQDLSSDLSRLFSEMEERWPQDLL